MSILMYPGTPAKLRSGEWGCRTSDNRGEPEDPDSGEPGDADSGASEDAAADGDT